MKSATLCRESSWLTLRRGRHLNVIFHIDRAAEHIGKHLKIREPTVYVIGMGLTETQIRDCEGCDWLGLVEIDGALTVGAWVGSDAIELDSVADDVKWGDTIVIDAKTWAVLGTHFEIIGDPNMHGLARRFSVTLRVVLRD
jgi:hypothetical protein